MVGSSSAAFDAEVKELLQFIDIGLVCAEGKQVHTCLGHAFGELFLLFLDMFLELGT